MSETQVPASGKFLLVTPVWNDAARLGGFGTALAEALADSGLGIDWLIADDGSAPHEREQLAALHRKLSAVYPQVSLHLASAHRGKGAVVREAWALHPDARWLAFVDADGSLPPAELLRMIRAAKTSGQTVLAIRKRTATTRVSLSLPRFLAHKLFILAARILVGVQCADPQCGAKVLLGADYRRVAGSLSENGLAFDTEMLAALSVKGTTWQELPVTWTEQDGGKVRPLRDAWSMLAALWRVRGRFVLSGHDGAARISGFLNWCLVRYLVFCAILAVVSCHKSGKPTGFMERLDKPSTYEEAAKKCPFKLPAGARNIYIVEYVDGLQDSELFIRFDLPGNQVQEGIEKLKKESMRRSGKPMTGKKIGIKFAPSVTVRKKLRPIKWWEIATIKNGYYLGSMDAHSLRLWIDSDNGRIYVYSND